MMPGETIMSGDKHVSPFKVMNTPAGYYIGTTFTHCKDACIGCQGGGWEEPGSRETIYFKTRKEAEAYLVGFLLGDMSETR